MVCVCVGAPFKKVKMLSVCATRHSLVAALPFERVVLVGLSYNFTREVAERLEMRAGLSFIDTACGLAASHHWHAVEALRLQGDAAQSARLVVSSPAAPMDSRCRSAMRKLACNLRGGAGAGAIVWLDSTVEQSPPLPRLFDRAFFTLADFKVSTSSSAEASGALAAMLQ